MAFLLVLIPPLGVAGAALSGIGHRWIDILAQFTGPATTGTLVVLAVGLAMRDRATGAAGVAVLALLLTAGAPQWVPPRGWPQPGSAEFTLYSANLHVFNRDIEAIAASVADADADIVVLIEVGDATAAALDRILPLHPHRASTPALDPAVRSTRSIIASRRPLRDLQPAIPRTFVVGAEAQTPVGPVTLVGVHLTRPWPFQFQWGQIIQAQGLTDWIKTVDGPVIAAGDFNSISSARIGRQIRRDGGLVPAPGWPGTWPARLPAVAGITIDQVYRTPDLAVVERRLGLPTGSDHRPVVTRFVRAAPPGA